MLSVRGRLLKDQAVAASGAERRQSYQKAAAAYVSASELGGGTYPLINAATLSLLSGNREHARTLARKVLQIGEQGGNERETPYYRRATDAEALLLLGETAKAKTALAEAVALAPTAFEDHASTLRQFGLILAELGRDQSLLDAFRPPRSLHFAGHMAPADAAAVARRLRAVLKEERIGFGFGALAAGSDILIAEALLEAGAELHLVLPATRDVFRESSVRRFGEDWARRFDHTLEKAETIRSISQGSDPPSSLALQLAAEIAMGRAVMQAEILMTEAVQLLVLEHNPRTAPSAGGSNWVRSIWEQSGRRQRLLTAARSPSADARPLPEDTAPNRLAAMLRIELSGTDEDVLALEILPLLARTLATGPESLAVPRWTGEAVLVAYETPAAAANAALAAATALEMVTDIHIAGHYATARQTNDPFGGEPFLLGPAMAILQQIAVATPAGAIHLTEDFAAALRLGPPDPRLRTEYVGELSSAPADDPVRLFSFRA